MGEGMRRIVLYACVLAVFFTSTATGDTEPNDDFNTAEHILAGTHSGELNCGLIWCDDEDYYKVTLVAGQLIYLNVTSTPETLVRLYDEQESNIESSGSKTSHEISRVTGSSAPPSFVYYVEVHRSSGEGPYTMEVSLVSQNDAGSGGDAGDRYDTATLISDGIRYSGFADTSYDKDYYAIGIQQECEVVVDLWSNQEVSAQASINDEERRFLRSLPVEYGAHDNTSFKISQPQTIYVEIWTDGTYEFQITLNPIDSTDGDVLGSDVLSLLWSWLPYILVILFLVFVVIAVMAVVRRK